MRISWLLFLFLPVLLVTQVGWAEVQAPRQQHDVFLKNSEPPKWQTSILKAGNWSDLEPYFKEARTRFEVKHTYTGGNSFARLRDKYNLVEFLAKMNMEFFNGGILPPPVFDSKKGNKDFEKWIKGTTKTRKYGKQDIPVGKTISVIDADVSMIDKDVKETKLYKDYMQNNPTAPWPREHLLTTRKNYPVTDIKFVSNPKPAHAVDHDIIVEIAQYRSQVLVGLDQDRVVYHYDCKDPTTKHYPKNAEHVTIKVSQLQKIADITGEAWRKLLGVRELKDVKTDPKGKLTYRGPLNVEDPRYKEIVFEMLDKIYFVLDPSSEEFKEITHPPPGSCSGSKQTRRKRSLGEHCAFYLDKDGKVETVDAEEFLKVFEDQSESGKRRMVEAVKENGDKITMSGEERPPPREMEEWRQKVNEKVTHEEIKAHVKAVVTVTALENLHEREGPLPEHAYKLLEEMNEKLTFGRIGRVRLSASKVAQNLANREYVRKFTEKVGNFAEPYGRLFLAGSVISGILHNDTTSLAIIGGRVGYDVVTETAVELGAKYFSTASKVGKSAKFLGEVAGPLGSMLDIGIGGWLISKSVDRLKNATNTYDRDDAIADIVQNSVDIAIGVGTLALSLAFPPAAPLIFAVGFVIQIVNMLATSMFHAVNDVAKIDAEVPLSGWEKFSEGFDRFFDWFGLREKDYVDYLYETKVANDRMAQGMEGFLKNNSEVFMGVVFPSQRVLHTGDESQPEPWHDSMVDFRETQTVWLDRDAPSNLEDEFQWKCRPGCPSDLGETASVRDSTTEYLCVHAMALEWKDEGKRGGGRKRLVKMDDGNHQVYLNGGDQTPAQFWMGDSGTKRFFGGGGKNEFFFDGNCTAVMEGEVHGGVGEEDCLIIAPSCGVGTPFTVEMQGPTSRFVGGSVNMTVGDIEELMGRPGESETVTVGCSTRFVALGGGKGENEADFLHVPKMECPLKAFQVVVENYTKIETNEMFGNLTMVINGWPVGVNISLSRNSSNANSKTISVFNSVASSEISLSTWHRYVDNSIETEERNWTLLALKKVTSNETVPFYLDESEEQLFYFNETKLAEGIPNSMSVLTVNTKDANATFPLKFYHTLSEINGTAIRTGCSSIPNIFNVTSSGWTVQGGEENDTFIVYALDKVKIKGGKSGVNTAIFRIPDTFVNLDLRSDDWIENVQQIMNVPGTVLNVTTACDTILASLQGGNETHSDNIFVGLEGNPCPQRNLQIQASGYSKVSVEGEVGRAWQHDNIFVIAGPKENGEMKFEADVKTKVASRLWIQIHVNHKLWNVVENDKEKLNLVGKSQNESILLTLKATEKPATVQFKLENSNDPPMPLIFHQTQDDQLPTPTVLFNLDESHPKFSMTPVSVNQLYDDLMTRQIEGFGGITNAFYLRNGSWVVRAGGTTNNFIGTGSSLVMSSVDGEPGQRNTLVVVPDESKNTVLVINLAHESISWQSDKQQEGWIAAMHHVVGRPEQADHIVVDCDTKSVAGRGGLNPDLRDEILILAENRDKCGIVKPLDIHLGSHTRVVNNQTNSGVFNYYVEAVTTSQLELIASANNSHRINYQFFPWRVLKGLHFHQNTSELQLDFMNDGAAEGEMYQHKFIMERNVSNPKIAFQPLNSSMSLEIEVNSSGQLETKYWIHGPPLSDEDLHIRGLHVHANQFVVNVTEKARSQSAIRGSSKARFNRFFLLNVTSPESDQAPHYSLEGGGPLKCPVNESCPVNSVYLDPEFQPESDLIIHLRSEEHGFIMGKRSESNETKKLASLENIHLFHGRNDTRYFDTIYPSCTTKQVSGVENVQISMDSECAYDLTINLDSPLTSVIYFSKREEHHHKNYSNGTFNYIFPRPMSFQITELQSNLLDNSTHNFLLPFKLTELESLSFDPIFARLYYRIKGIKERFWISMIRDPGLGTDAQFYRQPKLLTRDKFYLQVTRGGGSIILTRQGGPDRHSSFEMFARYLDIARRTGATIIHQSEKEVMHVADGGYGDRNAVQNMKRYKSWLSGGGDPGAYFEIVALDKDVYLYTGYSDNQTRKSSKEKQTLDLTDVVVPIRMWAGAKFVPTVVQMKNDLVIHMGRWQNRFPGRIFIRNGIEPIVWQNMQVLLSNSMMHFRKSVKGPNPIPEILWELVPNDVELSREAVYSIAAEDLEDNQVVRVEEYSSHKFHEHTNSFRFNVSRNGSNLLLSDLQEFKGFRYDKTSPAMQVSMTSVIITDFYKDDIDPATVKHYNRTESEDGPEWTLPAAIKNVTLKMPGLMLQLNGKNVTVLGTSQDKSSRKFYDPNASWSDMVKEMLHQ